MKHLSAILAFLMLATGQPFAAGAGVLCETKGRDCPAKAVLGVPCCCESGCECGAAKDRSPAPTQTAGPDSWRVDFALVEMPTVMPAATEQGSLEPFRIGAELVTAHAMPRVAVTCIRLN